MSTVHWGIEAISTVRVRVTMSGPTSSVKDVAVPEQPHQSTTFKFPKRSFGVTNRSFQPSWFARWRFLHYNKTEDAVYCHTCLLGDCTRRLVPVVADGSLVSILESLWYCIYIIYLVHGFCDCNSF